MYKVTYTMVAPAFLDPRVVVPDLQDKCGRKRTCRQSRFWETAELLRAGCNEIVR